MQYLPRDILFYLSDTCLTKNKQVVYLLSVCKMFHSWKHQYKFNKGYAEFKYDFLGVVPYYLKNITFEYSIMTKKGLVYSPSCVTKIRFSPRYDEAFEFNEIPRHVTDIEIPKHVKKLTKASRGLYINEGDIPDWITDLTIYPDYIGVLRPGVIPSSVKNLIVGMFGQSKLSGNCIPNSVEKLIVGEKTRFYGVTLPNSIKHLECPAISYFTIPDSVTTLKLTFPKKDNFPMVLKLPESIINLSIFGNFNYSIIPDFIPKSVKELEFEGSVEMDKFVLHKGLKKIRIGALNKMLVEGVIPDTVTHVDLGHDYSYEIKKGHIPFGVTHLTLSFWFNKILKLGVLPSSIEEITFGMEYNKPIQQGSLPPNITHVTFGYNFNHPFEHGVLPDSITHLKFGKKFNHPLTKENLPKSLHFLKLWDTYTYSLDDIPKHVIVRIRHVESNFF